MAVVKNVADLLNEQLGKKGTIEVFTTAAQTSKDFYAIHFVNESVITNCTITVIFAPFTAITLTSGLAIGYNN